MKRLLLTTAIAVAMAGAAVSARADDATTSPDAASVRAKAASFIATADDLYKRLRDMMDSNPKTEDDVDYLVHTKGTQFAKDEGKFRKEVESTRDSVFEKMGVGAADLWQALVRLDGFYFAILDTRMAIFACNMDDAQQSFKVAGEVLDHAKMALNGHPDPEWQAPDVNAEHKIKCKEHDFLSGIKIPPCDAEKVTAVAKNAVEQSPLGKTEGLVALALKDEQEISYDAKADKRTCTAAVLTNAGKGVLTYTVEWFDKSRGEFYVTESLDLPEQVQDSHLRFWTPEGGFPR